MFERFTPEALAVVASTPTHAIRLGHNYVGCEHLLVALVAAEEARGAGHLVARGVTVDRTEGVIREYVATIPNEADALRNVGVDPRAVRDAAGRLGADVRIGGLTPYEPDPSVPAELQRVTPRARTVLRMAEDAAADEVTCDDLLAAMLDEDGNLGVVVLEKLGVPLDDLRAELRN